MAFLCTIVVNQPVANSPGRIGQKGAPALLIAEYGLVKRQHGDAQLVLMAILRGGVGELHRLAADKPHILPNQKIRRFRIGFCRLDLSHNAVFRPHHFDSSTPSGRRIRKRCRIFGVIAENFPVYKSPI